MGLAEALLVRVSDLTDVYAVCFWFRRGLSVAAWPWSRSCSLAQREGVQEAVTEQSAGRVIRPERPQDREAIRRVNVAAFADHQFSRQTEHLIVEALRAADALDVSLVAELDGAVVGHIAFSQAQIGDAGSGWFLLGPVAVLPDHQARGIGRELVEAGLGALRSREAGGCVLVGDPAFYTRFGFTQIPGVTWAGVPAENVLCLRISGPAPAGEVACHPAFSVGPEQDANGGQR